MEILRQPVYVLHTYAKTRQKHNSNYMHSSSKKVLYDVLVIVYMYLAFASIKLMQACRLFRLLRSGERQGKSRSQTGAMHSYMYTYTVCTSKCFLAER